MEILEKDISRELIDELVFLSKIWEKENIVYGYIANDETEFNGKRIFVALDKGKVIGYLFGHGYKSNNMKSIMQDETNCFEIDELYVIPEYRSKGIGKEIFSFVENEINDEYEYITLTTASKNSKAILHFYLEEVGMKFWSARLYRNIRK